LNDLFFYNRNGSFSVAFSHPSYRRTTLNHPSQKACILFESKKSFEKASELESSFSPCGKAFLPFRVADTKLPLRASQKKARQASKSLVVEHLPKGGKAVPRGRVERDERASSIGTLRPDLPKNVSLQDRQERRKSQQLFLIPSQRNQPLSFFLEAALPFRGYHRHQASTTSLSSDSDYRSSFQQF
jgi:hypothetical protein